MPIPPGSSARSSVRSAPGYPLPSRVQHAGTQEDPRTGAIWEKKGVRELSGTAGKDLLHGPSTLTFLPTPTPTPHSLSHSAQPHLPFPIPAPRPWIAAIRPALTSGSKQRPSPPPSPPPFLPLERRGPSTYLGSWLLRVSLNVSLPRNCIRGQKGPVFVRWIRCRRLRWFGGVREAVELVC